ncbi:hypothetical protein CsSME_00047723 [Camellia sinensis var. sinensis]
MPSPTTTKFTSSKQKHQFSSNNFTLRICKTLFPSGLALLLVYLFLFKHSNYPSSKFTSPFQACHSDNSPTNITHLVFGLVSSINSWKARRPYVESWWRPNVTRGYLFLDKPPTQDLLPWPLTSPPLRISEDYSKLEQESKHLAPRMIRMMKG